MPPGLLEECQLWTTIETDRFWTIPEEELVEQIYAAFKSETDRLRSAWAIERNTPPLLVGSPASRTPSEIIFGEDYDEVNRTYTGILALRWTWTEDYERFTNGQVDAVKLTHKSFDWLRSFFKENIRSSQDLLSVVLSMVVNDLGKDPALVEDYFHQTSIALHGSNHDTILLEAAKHGLIPSMEYLDQAHRDDIILGLELGSELNAGQLAQAENVPVNLEGLLSMQGNERAFNLKFIEQMLDVAGAAGHVFAAGSKNMIEPVFQAFKTVHEVSMCIIKKECTLREGYDQVLSKRAHMLYEQGFKHLSIEDREQRAELRLLTMARAATLEQAQLIDSAFNALDQLHKLLLIEGLNIDAINDNETAVIPYYMPAMFAETIRNTRDSGKEQEAITSLMRYLARVLKWTDTPTIPGTLSPLREGQASTWPLDGPKLSLQIPATSAFQQKEGRVVERNVSRARDTISSPLFREDPSVLDRLDTPEGQVLQRRRTSASV